MATSKDAITFILEKLGTNPRFSARAMFGEYALYADGKVVALVCDETLYVKIAAASTALHGTCEEGVPYKGAKPHYIVTEGQLDSIENLPAILIAIAADSAAKKK